MTTNHGTEISNPDGTIHIYVCAYYDVLEKEVIEQILQEHKTDPNDYYIDRFINGVWYQMRVIYDQSAKEKLEQIKPELECFPIGPMGTKPDCSSAE